MMTDDAETSGQGITNGKQEYSSMTVKKYLFLDTDGRGPLKLMFTRSMGLAERINVLLSGL